MRKKKDSTRELPPAGGGGGGKKAKTNKRDTLRGGKSDSEGGGGDRDEGERREAKEKVWEGWVVGFLGLHNVSPKGKTAIPLEGEKKLSFFY